MYIYDNIALKYSQNEKYFREKLQRKSKHTFYVKETFSENRALLGYNVEKYDRTRQATDDSII